MATFSIISPLDQPLGKRRLLDDLKRYLGDKELSEFGFAVAFAKVGPLYRLQESLQSWKASGKKTSAIFGIDHNGTSLQALEFALEHLDEVYYTQYRGNSFHPKIYWFRGKSKAVAFIGSNNLTVGGTEINFEAAVELGFQLPEEAAEFDKTHVSFSSLLHVDCVATRKLTKESLEKLHADGLLLDESKKNPFGGWKTKVAHPPAAAAKKLPVKPASGLPSHILFGKSPKKAELQAKAKVIAAQTKVVDITKPYVPVAGVAMQIKPHHNGEIFLSKTAAQQNPAFFGMPFTGTTTPKVAGNVGYPQRTPDPVCNIIVFGKANKVLLELQNYSLNTVLYEAKAEIRVTASPLVAHVPEYSMLVMYLSDEPDVDYEMQIFTPDSPDFAQWLAMCDQQMPGGGKAPRKFGWF